jgi:hypothetical protein
MAQSRSLSVWAALLAVVFAFLTGWVQIFFGDLNLALLAAMAFSLAVGLICPKRVWIWGLLIGLAPPAAEFYLLARGLPVQRGAVQISFGALLPAFVGAYGGYFMRRMVAAVFDKGDQSAVAAGQEKTQKKSA